MARTIPSPRPPGRKYRPANRSAGDREPLPNVSIVGDARQGTPRGDGDGRFPVGERTWQV